MWWTPETDPAGTERWVYSGVHLIGFCAGFDADAGILEVDVAEPVPGHAPTVLVNEFGVISQRLRMSFQVLTGDSYVPNGRWIYWTGEGWIGEHSELVPGPMAQIVADGKLWVRP